MLPLSVIIPTFNEAHNIEALLQSLDWVDEILVVDSFSTDETITLAKKYTSSVVQRKYTGPADQKNWAIPQVKHDWVLILDADERLTPELKKEIQGLLQTEIKEDAFWIGRQSFFMGKKIRYSGWQGDAVIRLIRKDRCRYDNKQVHEEIQTEGITVGKLQSKLEHYTYKDLHHFLEKMQRYSEWSAQDHLAKTPRVTLFHLYLKPLFRFLKHYIIQLGILDGKVGFIISVIMAWGVFLRYVKIQEIHSRTNSNA